MQVEEGGVEAVVVVVQGAALENLVHHPRPPIPVGHIAEVTWHRVLSLPPVEMVDQV